MFPRSAGRGIPVGTSEGRSVFTLIELPGQTVQFTADYEVVNTDGLSVGIVSCRQGEKFPPVSSDTGEFGYVLAYVQR